MRETLRTLRRLADQQVALAEKLQVVGHAAPGFLRADIERVLSTIAYFESEIARVKALGLPLAD